MRALQKLIRNGSSLGVTIPRPILIELGWLPNQMLIVEVLEDRTVRLRPPTTEDLQPKPAPRLLFNRDDTVRA